jgi:hypothetical protein
VSAEPTTKDRIYGLVYDYFKGDLDKTILWFKTDNPMLGGVKPSEMIALNRTDNLLKFVESQLNENVC